MDACETNLLGAFLDGELAVQDRERVAAHVAKCPACQAEIDALNQLSTAFAQYKFDDLKPMERARLHRQLDEQVDEPVWRLGGAIGLIAASILVVAATWLAAIPAPRPGGNHIARMEPWEQVAVTGYVPVPGTPGDGLDQWMLEQLALASGSQP